MKTMKDFKGTKGEFKFTPYFNTQNDHEFALGSIESDDETFVAQIWNDLYSEEEAQANAKLFAASKKLLEVLVEARELDFGGEPKTPMGHAIKEYLIKVEQVINEVL